MFADFNASPRPTHPMTERCPRTELKAFNRLRNVARTRAVGEAPSTIWARGARRSADWIKIKTARRQEAVIVGFTAPRRSRPYFGALVLALETATAGAMSATSARALATPRSMSSAALPCGAFRSIGAQSTNTEGLPVNFLTVFCA